MRSFITLFVLLFATTSHAATVNIDFEGATASSGNVIAVPQGFKFTPLNAFAGISPSCFGDAPPANGNNYYCALSSTSVGTTVKFERIDGSTFDLLALDTFLLSTANTGGGSLSDDATISAWDSSNQLIATKTILYSELGSVWSTVTFDESWTGISHVTFVGQQEVGGERGSFVYLDNIQVNVVPIPPAIWLFGSALAGLGWLKRKQAV